MNRQTVLATVGTALSFGIAGCFGGDLDPREEAVIEYYEFEGEANELSFDQRKNRVE